MMASSVATELLATCNNLGYLQGETYLKEPECLVSLKDLIRFLKRDDNTHEVRRLLGSSKVLQTDLVPIAKSFSLDTELFDIVLRLMVNLTTPCLIVYEDDVPTEKTAHKHYLEVMSYLKEYKERFCEETIWEVLCEKLHYLLSLEWEKRLEDDRLLLERILVLVRNILHVPLNAVEEKRADGDTTVHDRILWGIHKSGLEDLILFLANSDDFQEFYLHTLEIITLMFRYQNPEQLSLAGVSRTQSEKEKDHLQLLEIRQQEQAKRQATLTKLGSSRHSRFGGTYTVKDLKSISERELIVHRPINDLKSLDFGANKAHPKKRRGQVSMQDSDVSHRSAVNIRLVLKEFCIEFLRNAYNSIMSIVKDQLARQRTQDHDETYYLWALRFFMEFNRLHDFRVDLISETMSVPTFHYVQTQLETYQEMMSTDKKKLVLWSKRMHLTLKAYHELMLTLTAMDASRDSCIHDNTKVLKMNIFYVVEYRELPYILLHHYDEVKLPRTYLKDLVEMTHVFLKLLEKHCKKNTFVMVQRKGHKKSKRTGKKAKAAKTTTNVLTEEQRDNLWSEVASDLSDAIQENAVLEDIIPFDAASEVPIDNQKGVAMRRIQGFLRSKLPLKAVALFRSSRQVWPEGDCFGSSNIEPDDEFLALREVFYASLPEGAILPADNATTTSTTEVEPEAAVDRDEEIESEEDEEHQEEEATVEVSRKEQEFDFKGFVARFASAKVVKAYCLLFRNWSTNSAFTNHCIIKMFHRFAWDCKAPAILFQATLFRDFQGILNDPRTGTCASLKEMVQFIKFLLRKFFEVARKNNKVFIEILFWKGLREAHEIEEGYGSYKEQSKRGVKYLWTEDMDTELKYLYDEYKDKADADKDVVDLIMDHFSDCSKTRRQIINQLKQLNVLKDVKELQRGKNNRTGGRLVPKEWAEAEVIQLRELYDQYKDADDVMSRILENLVVKRSKRRVVQKLLDLNIVSDRKQLRKKLTRKRTKNNDHSKPGTSSTLDQSDNEDDSVVRSESSGEENSRSSSEEDSDVDEQTVHIRKGTNSKRSSVVSTSDLLDILKTALNTEGVREALVWVRDDLTDIAKDKLEDEDIGAVPLVPILKENHIAMGKPIFVKVLRALGLVPPADEQETFWRYPASLSAEMCQQNVDILNQVLRQELDEPRENNGTEVEPKEPNSCLQTSNDCDDAMLTPEPTVSAMSAGDNDTNEQVQMSSVKRKSDVLNWGIGDNDECPSDNSESDDDSAILQVSKKARKLIDSDSE